jgi:hypothetical protein
MKNMILNKCFVLALFLIFIGAGILPNTFGYTKKTNYQLIENSYNVATFDNDYVNVYWMFDECSGDTLTDSAHDYDGTINGATWTSTSHSGCALIFDGDDDYVLLNDYSEQLGLNKTDDSIYSFWFKSTGGGLIFSQTAPWGYSPELRIELLQNGSLLFKAWTNLCGISIYSSDTYNDGEWHHAEFYFNGITANPTIDLFVDDDWDNTVTHWLCEIANDDFAKTRIGMHAYYSTDYFDGYIDDFEIIKYEQGNDQSPPTIDGPTEGKPDVEYEYTFVTEDPEGDEVYIQVDWDDGTGIEWVGPFDSGEEVTIDHEWDQEGLYEVKARSKDRWDHSSWSPKYEVRIGNQPPEVPEISGPMLGEIGDEYTFILLSEDDDGDNLYYYVDWGDGNYDDWFGPFNSGVEATASHAWNSKDVYSIRAKAKDEHGLESEYSDPYLINIGDIAPEKPDISGKTKGKAGVEYEYTFASIDADGDDISSYIINWGDDTGEVVITGPFASGEEVTASHTWISEGAYTITAKAVDIWGVEGDWGQLKVTMPKYKTLTFNLKLFSWLNEEFPNVFQIVRFILKI